MDTYWHAKNNSDKLIVFFNGWGNDEKPFLHMSEYEYDVVILSDYTNVEEMATPVFFDCYTQIYVIAWSMGVMVANTIMLPYKHKIQKALAINGSVKSVDNAIGIPNKIYLLTLRTLSEKSVRAFQENMCKHPDYFEFYLKNKPERTFESQKDELSYLYGYSESCSMVNNIFTHALIATEDAIFPVVNLRQAWNTVPCTDVAEPHYLFAKSSTFSEVLLMCGLPK